MKKKSDRFDDNSLKWNGEETEASDILVLPHSQFWTPMMTATAAASTDACVTTTVTSAKQLHTSRLLVDSMCGIYHEVCVCVCGVLCLDFCDHVVGSPPKASSQSRIEAAAEGTINCDASLSLRIKRSKGEGEPIRSFFNCCQMKSPLSLLALNGELKSWPEWPRLSGI